MAHEDDFDIQFVSKMSTLRKIEWLEDLAKRLEQINKMKFLTDINGLKELAEAFRRGLK